MTTKKKALPAAESEPAGVPGEPGALVVHQQTGEILDTRSQDDVTPALTAPGAAPFRQHAAEILQAPVVDDEIEILPTGEVYLSQIGYRRRLNSAFGPGAWALVAIGTPIQMGGGEQTPSLVQRFELWVLGRRVSDVFGEAEYHEDNPRQTWATAWESAKSNALMRACKDLGVASECWDRRWTEAYKQRCCVRVWRTTEQKPQWRRIDAAPWWDEKGVTDDSPNRDKWTAPAKATAVQTESKPVEGARPSAPANANGGGQRPRPAKPITEPQRKRMFAIAKHRAADLQEDPDLFLKVVRVQLEAKWGIEHTEEILQSQYDEICTWIEQFNPHAPEAAS